MDVNVPATDIYLAKQRRLSFYVCVKQSPRGSWVRLVDGLGLGEALEVAEREKERSPEVGVFVWIPSGGLLYWSSKTPHLYNSLVLREGYA